jgi:predicted protein tyrosine phosphatase
MNRLFSPDKIEEGLWLGSAPLAPEDFKVLKNLGITDVLSMRTEAEDASRGINPTISFRFYTSLNLNAHRVPVEDFNASSLKNAIAHAVSLIESLLSEGRQVYVHCALGMNRSPSVVAAYLGKKHDLDAAEAIEMIRALHPLSVPDAGAVRIVTGR